MSSPIAIALTVVLVSSTLCRPTASAKPRPPGKSMRGISATFGSTASIAHSLFIFRGRSTRATARSAGGRGEGRPTPARRARKDHVGRRDRGNGHHVVGVLGDVAEQAGAAIRADRF